MRRPPFVATGLLALLTLAAVAPAGCNGDPVHDNEVSALGGEAPGVAPGPTHRPGQPCLVCHGGSGPASLQFAVAGTVYQSQFGAPYAQNNATISLLDANGTKASSTTNSAGNFWVTESSWTPLFPVHVDSVTYNDISVSMTTHIGRDGSCATCHFDPPGGDLVGHIYLAPGDAPDGGFPGGGP
jgi:hypothetical protein